MKHLLRILNSAGNEITHIYTEVVPRVGDEIELKFGLHKVERVVWHTTEISGPNPARIGDQVDISVKPIAP